MKTHRSEIHLFSCACGNGASMRGCEHAPKVIQHSPYLKQADLPLIWHEPCFAVGDEMGLAAMPAIAKMTLSLAQSVYETIRQKQPFFVLGGDQSCSLGTWSGAATAVQDAGGSLGLIWIDAHMDSHTPETTESGNIHGMPLAALMHHGSPTMTDLLRPRAKLSPENVCIIGVRSFEKGEALLLKHLGVRVYFAEEVLERGVDVVMREATALVSHQTTAFGIALDMDGIAPEDAPGVGTPVENGIPARALLLALEECVQNTAYLGAEIVEFNPTQDRNQITERLVIQLMQVLLRNKNAK